ncbi:MAG: hypothetical protein RIF41_20040 [Polyangiaceae bacterium]
MKSDDGSVVAIVASIYDLDHVDRSTVTVDAPTAEFRDGTEATAMLCTEFEGDEHNSVSIQPIDGQFAKLQVRAVLREGTCEERGRYLDDAILSVGVVTTSAVAAGGAGGNQPEGGASATGGMGGAGAGGNSGAGGTGG